MELNKEFKKLKTFYDDNEFQEIFNHPKGPYFLKMRSISRTVILKKLAEKLSLDISGVPNKTLFEFLFCKDISDKEISVFIKNIYGTEREERREGEEELYSQLYKLKAFDWGGFYQNSVEKTIVNNYVKKIKNFDKLCSAIEEDISPRLKGYILCSWYNNWTSILIEDMFKDHKTVLPTVGLVKKIDFFWQDYPFDLKVTYFPEGFMQIKRKELDLRPELTELKKFARDHGISHDRSSNNKDIFSELLTKITEDTSEDAKRFIKEFHQIRKKIIKNSIDNPSELIKWLYEEQGERRFDAANRFFLILVDLRNMEESWKLKRNHKLLRENINLFLDNNKNINFEKLHIKFNWLDREYNAHATALFIVVE